MDIKCKPKMSNHQKPLVNPGLEYANNELIVKKDDYDDEIELTSDLQHVELAKIGMHKFALLKHFSHHYYTVDIHLCGYFGIHEIIFQLLGRSDKIKFNF